MNLQLIWQKIQSELKLTISSAIYKTWFKELKLLEKNNQEITIECPSEYTKETLDQKGYTKILKDFCQNYFHENIQIHYEIKKVTPSKTERTPLFSETPQEISPKVNLLLNRKYLLSNYIIGSSNNLAVAAAKAVIENPGKTYNPFFIYGRVGLGKTHIICAIGNEIFIKDPHKKVFYLTSEKFTNELIIAIQKNTTEQFREKYRQADVLIIDDIQFFAGKEASQEEFFHTFNALYTDNKQIILSSDKAPREIDKLEERLVSRFEGGLTVDIQAPDYETRVAILIKKCEEKKIYLKKEVIEYIAENVYENVRKLEGILSQVLTYALFQKKEVEIIDVQKILGERLIKRSSQITPDSILNTTAEFYGIKIKDLKGRSRKSEIVNPRQIAMYLLKKQFDISLVQIGEYLGGRDHTTVMHAIDKIEKIIEIKEENKYQEILALKKIILN